MYAVQRILLEGQSVVSKETKIYPNNLVGEAFKNLRRVYRRWKIVTDCLTKECKEFAAINPEDGAEIRFEFTEMDRAIRRPR